MAGTAIIALVKRFHVKIICFLGDSCFHFEQVIMTGFTIEVLLHGVCLVIEYDGFNRFCPDNWCFRAIGVLIIRLLLFSRLI